MATGPVLVSTSGQQVESDVPSTSIDASYLPDDLTQSNPRRHSMVFRSCRQSSEEKEDDEDSNDFSAELHDIRQRRYSVDLHRTRQKPNKSHSFALSYSDHPTRLQRSNTDENSTVFDSPFATPMVKKNSRPNSPVTRTIAVASRRRLASIRRESDCSLENLASNEFAHEKLVKNAQRVATGFEEFCLDDKTKEERKRAKSLAEPISVFTSTLFLPQSSSPSPKGVDTQKQCYSPSTNQILRGNIPYSNVSPTPSSPSRSRIMRSMSPISVRQISKRRFTATGSGMESDSESTTSQIGTSTKRQCLLPQRSAASPLVRDSLSNNNMIESQLDVPESYRSLSPASVCSNSSSIYNNFSRPKLTTDLSSVQSDAQSSFIDDNSISGELPDQSFLSMANENSSTAFSSRAPSRALTPFDEQMNEESDNASNSIGQNSPMRQTGYSAGFGIFGRDSSLPPPSPLASKSASLSLGDCNQ